MQPLPPFTMDSAQTLVKSSWSQLQPHLNSLLELLSLSQPKTTVSNTVQQEVSPYIVMMTRGSQGWLRVAGVCGALAIGIGAYGSHVLRERQDVSQKQRVAFETGSRYHLIHSVALLAVPHMKHPTLSGALFVTGMGLFSGGCYHYALTGEDTVRKFTPFGGIALIAAWLSLIF